LAQPRDDSLALDLAAVMHCCGYVCGAKIAACSADYADVAKRFVGTILVSKCGIVSAVLVRFDKLIKRCRVVFCVVVYGELAMLITLWCSCCIKYNGTLRLCI